MTVKEIGPASLRGGPFSFSASRFMEGVARIKKDCYRYDDYEHR
jgi:hypothetical protein